MSKPISGINKQILTWAREKSGQTIEDVAALIKKDPAVVSSWESGESSPTYVQLETLAYKVYKRPVALFFFPEPPAEPDPKRAFRTLPDAEIDELEADTRFKIREAVALQLSLADLTNGVNPAPRQILRDLAVSPPASASTVATRVRDYLGIDLQTQFAWKSREDALKGWRSSVEDAGVFVFKDSFKQKDVSGFSLFHPEFPIILINNSTAVARQIFTLFHELAHLLVHESGVTKRDDRFIQTMSGEARHIEVFCNQFAADFLVPTSEIGAVVQKRGTGDEVVADLADRYKVSREVVLRRLLDMGLVNEQRYRRQAAKWAEEYEQAKAAKKSGRGNYYNTHATYLSDRYANLAFSSYYRGSISIERLADYLNVKVKSIPGLEQAILQRAAREA